MATIGIDLGGTKVYAVRWASGAIEAEERVLVATQGDTRSAILAVTERLLTAEVRAIGIGVAGLVDRTTGSFAWGPHLADVGLPLREQIEGALALPVAVDNDCNTALIAELTCGAAKAGGNVLMITLGTGIGGAIAIDGRIYRGTSFAGEWGHMQVDPAGLPCACGRSGCWETRASGPALARLAKEAIASDPDSKLARALSGQEIQAEDIVRAAEGGDPSALAIVAAVGRNLGLGLASLVAIFDPDLLIIGGGLGSVGELVLAPAREALAESLHGKGYREAPPVRVAALGQAAGAVGAAAMAEQLVDT